MPTNSSSSKVILITGCSSGIGFASADLLARAGHTVYATARRHESLAKLDEWSKTHANRAFADRLDVTELASIESVVSRIENEQGRIDCVVNNAGYGQAGPVEEVSLDAWRRQFETNLFGIAAVTQRVLPMMRSRRSGRIINLSSVVAHLSLPMMGPYCASKHAVDAMSLALRVELAPYNVDVVLIEPGPIETEFRPNVDQNLETKETKENGENEDSPYKRLGDAMDRYWNRSFGKTAGKPGAVARAIQKAVESRRPKTRYRITAAAKFVPHLVSHLPDRLLDRIIHWQLRL